MQKWIIENAIFINQERTLIRVEWSDENGKNKVEEYISANVDNYTFKRLLHEISLEQIHKNTNEYNKKVHAAYKQYVMEKALEEGYLFNPDADDKNSVKKVFQETIDFLLSTDEEDKDMLFKTKLSIFEHDIIKNSKRRTLKSAIRKATCPLDVLVNAAKLIELEKHTKESE